MDKQAIILTAKKHDTDTGSTGVQISILTERIKHLTEYLNKNHKDKHSRRGLVGLVERRRKLIKYLKNKNPEEYIALADRVGLKK